MTLQTPPQTDPDREARRLNPPPRVTRLLDSPGARALGWAGVALGGLFVWWHPYPELATDFALAPLVVALLWVIVSRWADPRGARAAIVMYVALLAVSLVVSDWPWARLAARNFSAAGSAQLLVGLGSLVLLENLAVPLWLWAFMLVGASSFQPQIAFIPLLMMTLLRSRTLLVIGFVDKARAAALRCAAICLVALLLRKGMLIGLPIRVDSVTLPLAWWIASWLLDGEALMPHVARVLLAGILCVATVANFRAWPAMALVLLCGWIFARHQPRLAEPTVTRVDADAPAERGAEEPVPASQGEGQPDGFAQTGGGARRHEPAPHDRHP